MISASTRLPSLEQLIDEHASYMLRLPESERQQSADLAASLNITALRTIVETSVGATCLRIDKIYQGGFNQIYNLTFVDETKHAIARINMPFGGGSLAPEDERRDRVKSEVATLRWIREKTTIPVPQVFAFNENPNNEVGAAYIIEEKILGFTLSSVWPSMTFEARTAIVRQLADFLAQLYSTSFPMIGSLHTIDADIFVGPLAPPVEIETPRVKRGPWTNPREYLQTFITDQLEEIKSHPEKIISIRRKNKAEASPAILEEFKEIYMAISLLVKDVKLLDRCDPSWAPFSLSHPDLTPHNIMVDATDTSRVVAMIDWEGARIQPWWQRCSDLPFIREELATPADAPKFASMRRAWEHILIAKDVPGISEPHLGWMLGRLHLLVDCGFVSWSSVQYVVDSVMKWRLDWPQPDPAFKPLDDILRRYGAEIPQNYE